MTCWETLLPVPATPCSGELKVWVPKGDTLLPGDTARVLLNYRLQWSPGHFWLYVARAQWVRKEVTLLVG